MLSLKPCPEANIIPLLRCIILPLCRLDNAPLRWNNVTFWPSQERGRFGHPLYTGTLSHLRTMLPKRSSLPLPAQWSSHATWETHQIHNLICWWWFQLCDWLFWGCQDQAVPQQVWLIEDQALWLANLRVPRPKRAESRLSTAFSRPVLAKLLPWV